MRARFLLAVAVAVPALALAAPAVASPQTQFLVQHGAYALDRPLETYLVVTAPSAPTPPRVSIFVPAGYSLELPAAPGEEVGEATLVIASPPDAEPRFSHGRLVVAGSDVAADPRVERCARGPHEAIWELDPSGVLVLVNATRGAERALGAYRLDLCLGAVSFFDDAIGGRVLAAALDVKEVFDAPGVPGEYTWRALVAPPRAGDPVLDDDAAFELRTVVPLPYVMRLRAKYEPRRKTVAVRGTLTGAGRPRSAVNVFVAAMPETSEDGGVIVVVSEAGPGAVRTTRSGTFATRLPLRRSAHLVAMAWTRDRPCRGPSPAPAGCLAEATSPLIVGPFFVRVPPG
jgi:hypothetical protein